MGSLKVSRADLENASSTVRTGADNVTAAAKGVEDQIATFYGDSSSVLKGKGFDYVRGKMCMYQAAVQKLAKLAQMLANNIIQANNFMINKTEGLDLDTSNIEELEQRVAQIQSLINWYGASIVVDDTVPEEERKYKMRNKERKEYYEEVLKVIQEKLELLRSLPDIAAEAAGYLDSITADTSKFGSSVDAITVSSF